MVSGGLKRTESGQSCTRPKPWRFGPIWSKAYNLTQIRRAAYLPGKRLRPYRFEALFNVPSVNTKPRSATS